MFRFFFLHLEHYFLDMLNRRFCQGTVKPWHVSIVLLHRFHIAGNKLPRATSGNSQPFGDLHHYHLIRQGNRDVISGHGKN